MFAGILSAQAQNIIRPKVEGPANLWVNSYNGNLFFARPDAAAVNSIVPMDVVFYYNSLCTKNDYGYGIGFSLVFEKRYSLDDDGNVTIESGDGRVDVFSRYGNEYEAPAGVFSTLTIGDGKYMLRSKEGVVYEFGDSYHKRATAIVDRNGNRTVIRYDDGLLSEISDEAGHVVSFKYTNRLLTELTATFLDGAITYSYDSKKRLVKRVDSMGNQTLYEYDNQNRICGVTDAAGNKAIVNYNIEGKVSLIKKGDYSKVFRYEKERTYFLEYTDLRKELAVLREYNWNRFTYCCWDSLGRLVKSYVAGHDNPQMTLEYDEDNNVVKSTDANGNATSYTYDDRGNVLSMTDALGQTQTISYTTEWDLPSMYVNKEGRVFRFRYDAKGNLLSFTSPLGQSSSYTYNSKGWMLTATDANGNVESVEYNRDGTVSSMMDAAGNAVGISYDAYGNIVSVTDALGNTTSLEYDRNRYVTKVTNALGYMTKYSYDKVGNLVRVTDAKGRISACTYDANGNRLSFVQPDGSVYRYKYDNSGNIVSLTAPDYSSTHFEWDNTGHLSSLENAEGEIASFSYDGNGNLLLARLPNGNMISYKYDELNRLLSVCDNIGLIAEYTYDAADNVISITDAESNVTVCNYDAVGRLQTVKNPSGSAVNFRYDSNSNILSFSDACGRETSYTYNSLNMMTSVKDALNAVTSYDYDANGNLSRMTDAKGNSTLFTYDALGRNTIITFADGRSMKNVYDEVGNIISSTDRAGNEFRYSYDMMQQLVEMVYPDGSSNRYSYDVMGRLLSAVNSNATVNLTYDRMGRLLSETLNGKTTSYAYDVAAGKERVTYPTGTVVERILDTRNNLVSVLQDGLEIASFDYNKLGQLKNTRYSNGVVTSYDYNVDGRLTSIIDNCDILNKRLSYDAVGNITSCIDALEPGKSEYYGYDAVGRLTSFVRGSTLNKAYEFDLLGNRTRIVENGEVTNYSSNNVNSYTAVGGKLQFVPKYDANGNLVADGCNSYIYDYDNNLVGYNGNQSVYRYDALGRRIANGSTVYSYAGVQMIEETTNGQTSSYTYGNGIDNVLQMKRGAEDYYYHTNHLGSTMALSDKAGTAVERVEYDAYGMPSFYDANGVTTSQSSLGNPILFTGREYNAELQNYHYRARAMHPGLGRFMQKDPLMYVDGMNDYSYVLNNPVNFIDPSGLVVIFVNGFNDIFSGGPAYWEGIDRDIMNLLDDHNAFYVDGSQGGLKHNYFASNRYDDGYRDGLKFGLPKDEPITVVSHSMGGVYAKGMIKALLERGYNVQREISFAPFQSIDCEVQVPTYNYSHDDDNIAGSYPVSGATNYTRTAHPILDFISRLSYNPIAKAYLAVKAHGISSFRDEIMKMNVPKPVNKGNNLKKKHNVCKVYPQSTYVVNTGFFAVPSN